jgi:trigger factor
VSVFFDVEIPSHEVDKVLAEVYADISKHSKIPGFRPGKAPIDLIERYHGESAREEALKRLVPDGYKKVINEKNIDVVGYPEITEVVFEKGKNMSFKAKVEIKPKFTLKEYKHIKVKTHKLEVTDKEVESLLTRLQGVHAQYQEITEQREVAKGDYTVCDVEAFLDGKPLAKKHENMWIAVDKEASMLGMGEKLVGAKVGQTVDVEAELPKDYPDKKFAGQKADFKILIKAIKEKKIPALDDDFAKDMGQENFEALKRSVYDQLLQKKETDLKAEMKSQVLDKLLSDYKIQVPPSMVKRQYEVLMKRLEDEMLSRGVTADQIESKKKDLEKEMMVNASDKVKIYFILSAIADKEDVRWGMRT